jgi:hypothetical protein
MAKMYEIRADYDDKSITVYQAYNAAIALPAIETGKFQPPFSLHRMTWIKPSFLWMMARSHWGQKRDQEYILGIRITRSGWEQALRAGVLSTPEKPVYATLEDWQSAIKTAQVVIQWDPERSLRGGKLEHRSIQVGISRHLIQAYVEDWIISIRDMTPLVKKIYALRKLGRYSKAEDFLPKERIYPVETDIAARLGMSQ